MNKPRGVSSQKLTYQVRKLCGEKKAGHGGTLDPGAEGVLPVLLGRATKISDYLLEGDKHYVAEMRLGVRTDTQDLEGRVISQLPVAVSRDEVERAVLSMLGTSLQVPPMYSALKVHGERLYDLARSGMEVERQPREVTIRSIVLLPEEPGEHEYTIDVSCSKGTYIRTLVSDIGDKLGCGAVMIRLVRVEAAGLPLSQAFTLPQLEELQKAGRLEEAVIPVERYFSAWPKVTLEPFFLRLVSNGCEVETRKLGIHLPPGTLCLVYGQDGFTGLGEIIGDETALLKLQVKLTEETP